MTTSIWKISFCLLVCAALMTGCGSSEDQDEPDLRLIINPAGPSARETARLADLYERETGVRVEVIEGSDNASDLYLAYQSYLTAQNDAIDVYLLDVIWTGSLGRHFVDLSALIEGEREDYFPFILHNNTVDGRLVAMPYYGDVGLLFYRIDLLAKHGYSAPPDTWEELEEMAQTIVEAERAAGDAELTGFVWQGSPRESLTCNALEWQLSMGGGPLLDQEGDLAVNAPAAARAFERAASWVGGISPAEVTEHAAADSLCLFGEGRAVFMRNWAVFYGSIADDYPEMLASVAISPLPRGEAGRSGTIGGWQLAVSRYSQNQEAAREFVSWLTSPEILEQRARYAGYMPLRRSVYESETLREELPWMARVREAFETGVARPAKETRGLYNEISTSYYSAVHRVLTGESSGEQALRSLEASIAQSTKEE